jgi:very-short-patch-repair endonuclease
LSELEEKVFNLIEEAVPFYKVIRQYYVYYHNQQLRFDFYLPELRVCIEVQGQQHFTFNNFHYESVNEFKRQKVRDVLKQEWCEENNNTLIALKYDKVKELTANELKNIITAG